MQPLFVPPPQSTRQVRVFDMAAHPWQETANKGLWLKPVRHDDERGLYLGLVRFDAGTRSGLHQHQAVATSFVLDGGLTDYHGSLALHEAGINVKGSTHDAIAYRHTLLVSRLAMRPFATRTLTCRPR
jgi:anti-sigma factor ChrR (cupin superfamily)